MTAVKKGLFTAGNVIFIVFIVIVVTLGGFMVQAKLSGGAPSVGPYQLYVVLSGSMNPTFDTGSLIGVEKVKPEEIKADDIITFKNPDNEKMIVTHRVIDILKLTAGQIAFMTKGDANNAPDQKMVPAANLIGKEHYAVPYAGYLANFAGSKRGLLMLIIIPAALVIIGEMVNLFKLAGEHDAEEKRKKQIGAE